MWLRSWTSLKPRPEIVIAGSPDDKCDGLAREYGCHYVVVKNLPVGRKWNYAHQYAKGSADFYLTTGSDEIMSQSMWDFYQSFQDERLCLLDLDFIDTQTRKLVHWKGYDTRNAMHGMPIGAHQLHRHDSLVRIQWQPFRNEVMAHEHDTEKRCNKAGILTTKVTMADTGGRALCLKSAESYSRFAKYANSEWMDSTEYLRQWPEFEKLLR